MIILNSQLQEGFIILFVGIAIVFIALVLLFLVYNFLVPALLSYGYVKRKQWLEKSNNHQEKSNTSLYDSGEEMAAVSAAVHLFLDEIHDEENAILTIGKTVKNYSPWSSKIYTTHRFANRG